MTSGRLIGLRRSFSKVSAAASAVVMTVSLTAGHSRVACSSASLSNESMDQSLASEHQGNRD